MSVQPLEFIDFSKFEFVPVKVSRHREDPLALDIKEEPIIKEEPVDPSYDETPIERLRCKKEPLDEFQGREDPFADNSSLNKQFPLGDDAPIIPVIKEEPPDLVDEDGSLIENAASPLSALNEEETETVTSIIPRCLNVPVPGVPAAIGNNAATENWLLNSDCGRILSKDLANIITLSHNIPDELIQRCDINLQSSDNSKKLVGRKPSAGRTCFFCYHCGYRAHQKGHIRSHIIAIHGGKKPYSCRDCNLKFVQRGSLNRHIVTVHNLEKPFKCDRCEFTCGRKEGLKRHSASMHDNHRPFACSECQFKSVRKYHLDNHVRTVHRGERPFACSMCSYSAGRKSHLLDHVFYKHKGIKRFSCEECSFKANQKSNLKQHVDAVHKKLKPFICHHCDHRTNHKGSLRGHIIAFHLNKMQYFCFHCKFFTRNKNLLEKHIKKHMR